MMDKHLKLYFTLVGVFFTTETLNANVLDVQPIQMNHLAPVTSFVSDDMNLYLELVINLKPTGHIVNVEYTDGYYYIGKNDLNETSVPQQYWQTTQISDTGKIAVD